MSEERALLVATADRLFQGLSARRTQRLLQAALREIVPGEGGSGEAAADSAQMLQETEDSGVGSLLVPEKLGGVGASFEDAGAVIERAGWHTIDLPVVETMIARALLARAAPGATLPDGAASVTVESGGKFAGNDNLVYSGSLSRVPWGASVAHIVVPASDGQHLAAIATAAAHSRTNGANLAGDARDELVFHDAPARVWEFEEAQQALFNLGALARVAQISGALAHVLQLSVDHASSRRQFGKALSEFQVIQHQLALLAEEAAAVSCARAAACRAADLGDFGFEVAAAKLRANHAVGVATAIAHQVHGAMGCTQDHLLQRLTRRLWAWRSEFGNDRYWADWLGTRVCTAGVDQFWPILTALGDRMSAADDNPDPG